MGYPWDGARPQGTAAIVLPGVVAATRHEPRSSVKPSAYRGALPRTPALPRRWSKGVISSPGQAKPYPGTSGTARARFDRPCGHTLAVPGEPGVARRVPTEEMT